MQQVHHGACLCGGIQFRITGALAPIQVCHCSQCRQAQGGPFATNIPVDTSALTFTRGEELITRFESSPGKVRAFCAQCGSPVFSARDSMPGVLRIRAGLLQEPVPSRPGFHIYADSACSWWPIQDDLPQYQQGCVAPQSP